jgi:hypothetical protein
MLGAATMYTHCAAGQHILLVNNVVELACGRQLAE